MRENIRAFRGSDAKEAFAAVRAALGGDAVILSAREIPGGLLRRAEVEVLAMVRDAPAPAPAAPPVAAPAQGVFPDRAAQVYAAPPLHAGIDEYAASPRLPEDPLRAHDRGGDEVLAGEVVALRRSVEEARLEMRQFSHRTRSEVELRLRPTSAEVFNRLVAGGVEDALAEELVRQAQSGASAESTRTLMDGAFRLVSQRFAAGRAPWHPGPRRALALVGPTGVGKTTTLAKIAARALLDSKLRVSLVTVDTYRVGGSEQLARYGEIMGIPSHVARTAEELSKAIARSRDADLVLVDTAGRATSEAVAQQAELLRAVPGLQLTLVISAATGWRELAAVAERYRKLRPEGLIVSKLDEAVAPGGVLSAAVRLPCPITCIADGQRVPDDLHEAIPDDLTDRAMASCRLPAARRTSG